MAGFDGRRAGYRDAAAFVCGASGPELHAALIARGVGPGFRATHPAEADAEVTAALGATSQEVLAAELAALAESEDLRPRLSRLTTPILLRVGADDVSVPPTHSEEIARRAQRATPQVVPGCGHSLLLEDRTGTVAALVGALSA
jgi:pimeloyl-ACP methyl ester carboxylesterase